MPKSKRNKTVDLSKTKKHGLEGKKELYKKIQSNVENYAHVFLFAVNDMRNSKMKNVREQWKHSRFCIGKNKVMAMALGRTPEEEYRTNLHKIGQMLIGERGLLFTNQSVAEVTNWFESYSEGDFARSGNIATEDVILPEGPLAQFPHNLESYLRQLGLPTTLKKGVIHLVKEHVVCTEGDRLSPETARILKLLGYEMAEFRIKILSVWSQDGSFAKLQSDSCDPESKENAAHTQKSFMREDFELAKDCLLLGDDDEMEIVEIHSEDKNEVPDNSEKETKSENAKDIEEEIIELEVLKPQTPKENKSLENVSCDLEKKQEGRLAKSKSKKTRGKSASNGKLVDEMSENSTNSVKDSKATEQVNMEEITEPEEIIELEVLKPQTPKENKSSENVSCDLEKKQEVRLAKSKKTRGKSANNGKLVDVDEMSENSTNSVKNASDESSNHVKDSEATEQLETEDVYMEEITEPEVKKPKNDISVKKSGKRNANKGADKKINKNISSEEKEEAIDSAAILKLTAKKLEESVEEPKKYSPKMTRARAAATNKKIKTPEPIETQRNSRKRKM